MTISPGDKYERDGFCPNYHCCGKINGIFGGKFYVGETEIEYTQILNSKCDRCGLEKPEIFEVWDKSRDDFYISLYVTILISIVGRVGFEPT
ncbi:MAG: hypothetical protein HC775_17590 [Hyellaceae cyanobacterium CSU_1_1]|nr:hypothetical protein [Hyellaceae cyanobacterium CSU_1_1]